jgi:hypothetical protein
MSDTEVVPGLTPRAVAVLLRAGEELAHEVDGAMRRGPRPVFLYYIAQTFDTLRENLSQGRDPRPRTPAEQLCLHLLIERAERLTGSLDADLIRVHRALLPDHGYQTLAEAGRGTGNPELSYDFIALGDALTPRGMSAFFAPFEPDDLVA